MNANLTITSKFNGGSNTHQYYQQKNNGFQKASYKNESLSPTQKSLKQINNKIS